MVEEYIKRQAAIKCINETSTFAFTRTDTIERLNNIPSEDVVKVVLCKDCKHRGQLYRNHLCDHPMSLLGRVSDDTFCSYGERKDSYDI